MGNMLVIMSDEHQARAMGCAGHSFVQTPNLDALAARGTRFTNAYTPSPICVPARAAFATGKDVHRIRCWDNAMPYHGQFPSWGHALQNKGVAVQSIGKLHYRNTTDDVGFDKMHLPMMVAGGVGQVWGSVRRRDERRAPEGRMLGPDIGPGESNYTAYDRSVTQKTVDWLAEAPDEPWCLYVGLVAPHFPLVAPQDFYNLYADTTLPDPKLHPKNGHSRHPWLEQLNEFQNNDAAFSSDDERDRAVRAYYGLCSWLDHNVGCILTALDAAGLGDDTTVIYTSDHGDNLGARGLWGKSNLYEESACVPLIMAGPEIAAAECETPVSLLDVAATIPEHFKADFYPATHTVALQNVLKGNVEQNRPVFSQYHAVGSVTGAFMVRSGDWKLISYAGFPSEMFDLRNDPEELTNLIADPESADMLASLKNMLIRHFHPDSISAMAFADQAEMITEYGGVEAALKIGAPSASPPPDLTGT